MIDDKTLDKKKTPDEQWQEYFHLAETNQSHDNVDSSGLAGHCKDGRELAASLLFSLKNMKAMGLPANPKTIYRIERFLALTPDDYS